MPNPPFRHATDGTVQLWNTECLKNPCAGWNPKERVQFVESFAKLSETIRPPQHELDAARAAVTPSKESTLATMTKEERLAAAKEAHDARKKHLTECRTNAEALRAKLKPWAVFVRKHVPISANSRSQLLTAQGRKTAVIQALNHPGIPEGIVVIWRDQDQIMVGASHLHPSDKGKFNRHEAFITAVANAKPVSGGFSLETVPPLNRQAAKDAIAESLDVLNRAWWMLTPGDVITTSFYLQFPSACHATIRRMLKSLREQERAKAAKS